MRIGFLVTIFFLTAVAAKSQNVLEGKAWSAKKVGETYILSVKTKQTLVEAFTDFVVQNKISAGSISGIGAVNQATLRFFNPDTKKFVDKTFDEQMEIVNLTGNISTKDGKPYLHIHVTLGNADYQAYAGHLLNAKLRGAGEFYIETVNAKLERKFDDEETGLNLYDFKK